MSSFFPAWRITVPAGQVPAALELIGTELEQMKHPRAEVRMPHSGIVLHQRGGKGRKALAILANALAQGGGGNFNVTYYVLVEAVSPTDILFTLHGVDLTMHRRFVPHEVFAGVFDAVRAGIPGSGVSRQFDGHTLPRGLYSSPRGFPRLVGPGRAFWWG